MALTLQDVEEGDFVTASVKSMTDAMVEGLYGRQEVYINTIYLNRIKIKAGNDDWWVHIGCFDKVNHQNRQEGFEEL